MFFFLPPKSEYFFQEHWESEYFLRKKTITFKLKGRSISVHLQLIKKYFFVRQTSCSTIKNIHKSKMCYESNQHEIDHYVMHYNYSLFQYAYAVYLNICCQYYNRRVVQHFYSSVVSICTVESCRILRSNKFHNLVVDGKNDLGLIL